MTQAGSDVEELVNILLAVDVTEETVKAGETHYVPPLKHALRDAGTGGDSPENVEDAEAAQIIDGASIAFQIRDETGPRPSDPTLREKVCKVLGPASDHLGDALSIASVLVDLGFVLGSTTTPLGVATIAVLLTKIGIRQACAGV